MPKRVRVIVEGHVQGVFFRAATKEAADSLGVAGWVRNLTDGRVEAAFEGADAAVDSAVEWARHGPDRALVTSLKEHAEQPEGVTGFSILR